MLRKNLPAEVEEKIALSVDEELFWSIANLLQVEEHLLQTIREVEDDLTAGQIKDIISIVRSKRVDLMKLIGVSNTIGESWCAAKHMISAAYRLLEACEKCLVHYNDLPKARKLSEMARSLEEIILLVYRQLTAGKAKSWKNEKNVVEEHYEDEKMLTQP